MVDHTGEDKLNKMIEIKKATLEHLAELVNAFEAYRVWYRKEADLPKATEFLKERIENNESVIFLALEQNKVLGFTQLYPLFSSTRMKRLWLLNDLFVHPEHRGKGISKSLINEAKELCKQTNGCGVMLETEKNNDIGNNLYPATEFKLNTEHNFYEWSC